MKYIYCTSTYPIFVGLYLRQNNEEVCFIYTRSQYKELFDLLNLKSYFLAPISFKDFFRISKVKQKIDDLNKLIGTQELHFTHFQFAIFLFIFLQNREKGSKSIFYDFEPYANHSYTFADVFKHFKEYLSIIGLRFFSFLFYKSKLQMSYFANQFYISLDRNKLAEMNVEKATITLTFEELQNKTLKQIKINHASISNLYIAQNEFIAIDKTYSKSSVLDLYKFIETHQISVKPHPLGYPHPKTNNLISPNIPSEFLYGSITGCLMSIGSTALISASHFYGMNSNVKIICLMKLIEVLDKDLEKEMIDRIINRSLDNIYFPNSLLELATIIDLNE